MDDLPDYYMLWQGTAMPACTTMGILGGLKPITMAHQKRKEIEIKEEKLPG